MDMPYKETEFPFGDKTYRIVTKESKIVLPKALQTKEVKYNHTTLCHPGETQTELTMARSANIAEYAS
jgi:hypothetical protein